MDAIVAKPYGIENWKKDSDFVEIKNLENKLFPKICNLLNNSHQTKYSERFWWIVLGHWFEIFVRLIFKNVNTINNCLELNEISGTTICHNENYKLLTLNYAAFNQAIYDVKWNSFLFTRILTLQKFKNLNLEIIKEKNTTIENEFFEIKKQKKHRSIREKIFKLSYKGYKYLANKFVRNNDAFIINPYLPFKEEIKLELALHQFPQLWRKIKPEIQIKSDHFLRKNLTEQLTQEKGNNVENILRSLLFELIPLFYLEGFSELKKISSQQPWPNSPKFIYTANNFNTDDVFKLWAAIKIENGSKYYIGQHGNSYYTLRNFFPRVEEKTSDKFFTWGWENNDSKFKPAFIFNTAGKKEKKYNKQGELLLIEKQFISKFTWDTYAEYENYFKSQKKFVERLQTKITKKMTIKLHPRFHYKVFDEQSRWKEFNPKLNIETKDVNIYELILNSRLVVYSYDSTGILENFSQNIPTLAFWQNNLDHLRDEVKNDYQILIDAGIIHLSVESATDKINEIWNDVDGWWYQKNVQEAKIKFCAKYARHCDYPAKKMANLLMEK